MLQGGAEAPAGQTEGEAALSRVGERAAAGLALVRRRRVAPDESHPGGGGGGGRAIQVKLKERVEQILCLTIGRWLSLKP